MTFRVVREGDTWGKLGYLDSFDSREFRRILELNPTYDIRSFPAVNLPVKIRGNSTEGTSVGTLIQTDGVLDLSVSRSRDNPDFFPWSSQEEFDKRLIDYSPSSLSNPEELNGYKLSG